MITDEDIRQSGAIDIPTLLRRIPGMEVMQTNGTDFNVSVRGDNQPAANKLLVMVDGRSIYIDAQGVVYWKLLPVTLPEIKRIEVLKGPASAIYGFNAFDGIINIITKVTGGDQRDDLAVWRRKLWDDHSLGYTSRHSRKGSAIDLSLAPIRMRAGPIRSSLAISRQSYSMFKPNTLSLLMGNSHYRVVLSIPTGSMVNLLQL